MIGLPFLFFVPYIIISFFVFEDKVASTGDLPKSDIALVFGAHITEDEKPTEILQERLDAAIQLYKEEVVSKVVVSNTERASVVMKDYLLKNGVSIADIELDTNAELTSDSCRYELDKEVRSRIFLSQGFHLNRILFLCEKLGVDGAAFPVETISRIDKSSTSFHTKIYIRSHRFVREVVLSWPVLFGVYI